MKLRRKFTIVILYLVCLGSTTNAGIRVTNAEDIKGNWTVKLDQCELRDYLWGVVQTSLDDSRGWAGRLSHGKTKLSGEFIVEESLEADDILLLTRKILNKYRLSEVSNNEMDGLHLVISKTNEKAISDILTDPITNLGGGGRISAYVYDSEIGMSEWKRKQYYKESAVGQLPGNGRFFANVHMVRENAYRGALLMIMLDS